LDKHAKREHAAEGNSEEDEGKGIETIKRIQENEKKARNALESEAVKKEGVIAKAREKAKKIVEDAEGRAKKIKSEIFSKTEEELKRSRETMLKEAEGKAAKIRKVRASRRQVEKAAEEVMHKIMSQ
jgi:vacuolar-type H+-ATPase subunit H